MKLSTLGIVTERVSDAVDFLLKNKDFIKLHQLAPKYAMELGQMWQAEKNSLDAANSKGERYDSIIPSMLTPDYAAKRYGVKVTPDVEALLSRLLQVAYSVFASKGMLKGDVQGRGNKDQWGYW